MDPLSHVLFSRTLIALDRDRRLGRHAVGACALGALAPDVDAIAISRGWDVYLRFHEIGTHSVPGALVIASAAAALVYLLRRRGPYVGLMLAAWTGAISHLAFDLLSGATVRPGWPAFHGRLSVPLVAMADPWLVSICVTGAIALWAGRCRMNRAAVAVLATIGIFLALKGALMALAIPRWTSATTSDVIVGHAVEASWGSLTEWNLFDRTPHALRKWRVMSFDDRAALEFSLPLQSESPVVRASRSLDTVDNFLQVHDFGFAVTTPAEGAGTQVLWSDIRYCWSETECALWFGGTFDREGRPVRQVVQVGGWRQIRPVEP